MSQSYLRGNLMAIRFHFLNVKQGDCSIIEHESGHVSVIDVCNATKIEEEMFKAESLDEVRRYSIRGNFNQKEYPVNPIEYLKEFGVNSVFRFVVTHPDMDHLDGIECFFEVLSPVNFYDIDNKEEKEFEEGAPYREEDWLYYKSLRDNKPKENPQRLTLYSGDDCAYRTKDWNGNPPGDSFYVLSPTKELVKQANETGNYNDCSYVILFKSPGGRILLSGDSSDKTWEHILENHEDKVKNIDLLIAPHHGRKSDRSYDFLKVVNPKLTFFGNANHEHLAYPAWNNRKLPFVTNNQANCMVVDCSGNTLSLYVTNETFAKKENPETYYSERHQAYYIGEIT